MKREDIPEGEYFAILEFSRRYVPGAPGIPGEARGHEYPGGYEDVMTYTVFKTEQELLAWIKWHPTTKYVAIRASKLKVITEVKVSVG